jgi:hypothetical protein
MMKTEGSKPSSLNTLLLQQRAYQPSKKPSPAGITKCFLNAELHAAR